MPVSELTSSQKEIYITTAKMLKGSDRRLFMARVVKDLGHGGQRYAERELYWDRDTIRKGTLELETGEIIIDNFSARGRKKSEEILPNLFENIRSIVEGSSQTDSTFRTSQMYTRLTARSVHQALIDQFDYTDQELPCENTIRLKMNKLGYKLRPVQKSRPKKNSPKRTPSSINCSESTNKRMKTRRF